MPPLAFLRKMFGRGNRREYWEARYRSGGNSGIGSYGEFARFKAEIINTFVLENRVLTVIEFGCGDGHQLSLMNYPEYVGIDVSETAIRLCMKRFAEDSTKRFFTACDSTELGRFDLALSLDVIFHLTQDATYECYMRELFAASGRFVIIYSSNGDPLSGCHQWSPHVKHRRFTDWVEANAPEWKLMRRIPNRYPFSLDEQGEHGSFADFYIFGKSPRS